MKILVCITHVPDTTAKIAFDKEGKRLQTEGLPFVIGPYDDYALAKAVGLKEMHQAEVSVLHIGNQQSDPSLRKALAIGADYAFRIEAETSDTKYVAEQIAHFIQDSSSSFDLIMMGREAADFNGGLVPAMVGELTGIEVVSPVMSLEIQDQRAHIRQEIEGGTQLLEAPLPLILGCQEPIAEWKIPNMRGIMLARSKPITEIASQNTTKTTESLHFSLPKEREKVRFIEEDNISELVRLLKDEAKVL